METYLAGYGSWLPPVRTVTAAVAAGDCSAAYAQKQDIAGVSVGTEGSGPQYAVRAGTAALRCCPELVGRIELLLHSALYYQGHDMWAPASYVARYTVGPACPAIDVRQTSNGGMASLGLAAAYLAGRPAGTGVLLTAGDRFCGPGIDRWHSDPGTVFADGGAAVVVSNGGGFARLRSLVTVADAELEGVHRGGDPWSPGPHAMRTPLDVRLTTRAFVAATGRTFVADRMRAGQASVVKRALAEADAGLDDVTRFVLPNFGLRRMAPTFFEPFGIAPERTTWPWGRAVGHLGAGDQFAGLTHLLDSGAVAAGDLVALLGVGGGFTWSCAILELI